MIPILIIDDEEALVRSLTFALRAEGYQVYGAHTGADGLAAVRKYSPAVALIDLRLPDMSGQEVLEQLSADWPDLPLIMISAHGDTRAAVKAVKSGAVDYLSKPFELDDLFHILTSTLERDRMAREIDFHRKTTVSGSTMIGQSPAMVQLDAMLRRIAASNSARILLLGESGTGKALVAKEIHTYSARAKGPFVEVNCASLPEQLVEAELFGAEKGSYTGAHDKRIGLVSLAEGGTLFLDEIAELPLPLQAKFLHLLENGNYRPIGSTRQCSADIRVIAATNRDLPAEVAAGRFREDLFYRLNVMQIRIPALRDRSEDAQLLAQHFANLYAKEEGCRPVVLAPEVMARFKSYPWPGNVRELKNLIERLTIMMSGRIVCLADLPRDMVEAQATAVPTITDTLVRTERDLVESALRQAVGHKGRAAEILGISRHAFKRRLQRLGLG